MKDNHIVKSYLDLFLAQPTRYKMLSVSIALNNSNSFTVNEFAKISVGIDKISYSFSSVSNDFVLKTASVDAIHRIRSVIFSSSYLKSRVVW